MCAFICVYGCVLVCLSVHSFECKMCERTCVRMHMRMCACAYMCVCVSVCTGRTINYTILPELLVDDSIFNKKISNLSYSGFADCDFTIVNDRIIIFEINPCV